MKHPYKIIGLAVILVAIIIYVATRDRSIHEHHPHDDHDSHEHLDTVPLEEHEQMSEDVKDEL